MGYHKVNIDPSARIAPGAAIVGDVEIGPDCTILFSASLRGDCKQRIEMGAGSNLQEQACIHVDHDSPCIVGEGVTIGHGAIVHGCTIGDNSLIGMHATVLNGARIGRDCLIAAGALVTENAVIPDGSLVMGVPAHVKRPLTEGEIAANRASAEDYIEVGKKLVQDGILWTGKDIPADYPLITPQDRPED